MIRSGNVSQFGISPVRQSQYAARAAKARVAAVTSMKTRPFGEGEPRRQPELVPIGGATTELNWSLLNSRPDGLDARSLRAKRGLHFAAEELRSQEHDPQDDRHADDHRYHLRA